MAVLVGEVSTRALGELTHLPERKACRDKMETQLLGAVSAWPKDMRGVNAFLCL